MSTATAKLFNIFTGGGGSSSSGNSSNNSSSISNINNTVSNDTNDGTSLLLKAPSQTDIKYFNEPGILQTSSIILYDQLNETNNINNNNNNKRAKKAKKKVTFPEDGKIIKDYSEPPKLGWTPGTFSTVDLLESYLKSCERHKCKPLNKLIPHLKALQDLDCANGEKVNVLNLKHERFDSKQMEALEEIFKRLSFKTIDLESSSFDDDSTGATLFEILQYYDTCERLILANTKTISLFGWQELSKFIRKSSCIEYLDLRGHIFPELIYFTYIARSFKLTLTLRVIHLEYSNLQGRYLIMLAAALKDNEIIKEVYLSDNKLQSSDGNSIATLIKENNCLELIDLKNNNLQDIGLSYICSGLSEKTDVSCGLRNLVISNNNLTANGISYLSKALIHNRSLTSINIGLNSLTNEAIYELKDALIVNKQISALYLNKTKLTDEGTIALAEYIAETQSLTRLDLRENDIRLGGLMALMSSLKFNKTLCRLDLDREPKKENSIRDSLETSKQFIQIINEYCIRNKRLETERQLALKELALKEEQERKKLESEKLENDLVVEATLNETSDIIVEDVNDCTKENQITSLDESALSDTNDSAIKPKELEEELVDLIGDEDEKLLKKILNRNLHSVQPNLHSPMSNVIADDLMSYLSSTASTSLESDYQLVESLTLESITTTSTISNTSNTQQYQQQQQQQQMNESTPVEAVDLEQNLIEKDIIETAKDLVDNVIRNSQLVNLVEPSNVQTEEKNQETSTAKENDSSILLNESSIANFNDSNDLSLSIEKETSIEADELNSIKTSNSIDTSSTTLNGEICYDNVVSSGCDHAHISSSMNDEEDESDIEVLTVSSKSASKELNVAVLKLDDTNLNTLLNDKLKSHALLDSITEHEVDYLINNKTMPGEHTNKKELIDNEIESAAIISNYDLITDHVTPNGNNSFQMIETPGEKDSADLSLNEGYKLIMTSNEATTPPPTPTLKNVPATSSPFTVSDISCIQESTIKLSSTDSQTANDATHHQQENNFLNDLNNAKPFFASELTNSQMSEELSHEIGLTCE